METWLQLQARIHALTLRERLLVFLSVTAVLFMLWDLLIVPPQHAERESLILEMQSLKQKFDAHAQELTVLAKLTHAGIDGERAQQLAGLEKENSILKNSMSELVKGFAPADELLSVLRDVLEQSSKLKIRRIESLPPVELKFSIPGRSGNTEMSGVFRHTVVITLESSYPALFHYLQGLEELPWRFYWDSLDYKVSRYPVGIVELRASTLTIKET